MKRPWELSDTEDKLRLCQLFTECIVSGPVTLTSFGNLGEIQILGPLSRANESKTLGVELSDRCFEKASRSFQFMLKL